MELVSSVWVNQRPPRLYQLDQFTPSQKTAARGCFGGGPGLELRPGMEEQLNKQRLQGTPVLRTRV